jgi:hypothetical protein
MPYASEAQRGYMHVHHPDIAARWDAKYGGKIRRRKPKKAKEAIKGRAASKA